MPMDLSWKIYFSQCLSTSKKVQKKDLGEWGLFIFSGAEGRTRTGTQCELRQILSLMRLPISPLGNIKEET